MLSDQELIESDADERYSILLIPRDEQLAEAIRSAGANPKVEISSVRGRTSLAMLVRKVLKHWRAKSVNENYVSLIDLYMIDDLTPLTESEQVCMQMQHSLP